MLGPPDKAQLLCLPFAFHFQTHTHTPHTFSHTHPAGSRKAKKLVTGIRPIGPPRWWRSKRTILRVRTDSENKVRDQNVNPGPGARQGPTAWASEAKGLVRANPTKQMCPPRDICNLSLGTRGT